MTRVLLFVLLVLAAALGLAWLADRPGTITIDWLGYQIQTTAFIFAIVVFSAAVLLTLIFVLLRYLLSRPAAMKAYVKERRRQHGYDALSRGLLAIGVGNRAQAQRYAAIAGRNLPREPLTALLRAQTAQLKGDKDAARRSFESMLDNPETQLLGVRGLFLEAQRGNDMVAARTLAEQAVKSDPKLGWGVNALFDMQARAGDWEGALETLAIARQNGHVEAATAKRRRAVLLTAEAREEETSDPDKALALANEALGLAPSLVPAAEIAGRILAARGESRQASKLITKTWKLSPHPDLATIYAFARPGDSPRERLKRVKQLASLVPDDIEGPIAVANAAIEAHDWREGRAALAPYVEDRPSARICTLMARIEAGEGDRGREREWLARAVRAPRDRAWIAEGYVSDRWLPVSPITGAVDAFEWKAPVDAIGRGDDTLLIEERPEPAETSRAAETRDKVVDVTPVSRTETPRTKTIASKTATPSSEKKPEPAIFVPTRPPDDPGVAQAETDESPTSLERLRAAQIR
ncbi:MAG: heme biosynthesis protein HemY [Methyloceanibacter sp.]